MSDEDDKDLEEEDEAADPFTALKNPRKKTLTEADFGEDPEEDEVIDDPIHTDPEEDGLGSDDESLDSLAEEELDDDYGDSDARDEW